MLLQFTLQGTNTYIVGTGAQRLIIDTAQGIPEWAEIISSTLSDHGTALSHVLLSHWHGDHTGGVPDLLRLYSDLTDSIYKHTPSRTQQNIADGQVFSVEGATVRAVHSPGHSHDHMCFILEEENAMFTGDNVLGHGTAAVEHLGEWMNTLRAMQSHGCTVGYPAHGMVIKDLNRKINGELVSKQRREERVLNALLDLKKRFGRLDGYSATVPQLVRMIHGDELDDQVRVMAVEPFMEEVLRKLTADGKTAYQIRGGIKKWFAM